ncbi:hypothetical protein TrVFT333_006805 [Trichoderma virens FT-333]|nr:hypothetical protein TrVFT333_006805 [Trichoderma virens FT-333]
MAVPMTLSIFQDAIIPAQGPLPFERKRTFNKERAQAILEGYQKNPLDNDSYVDPDTQNRRNRIWEDWHRFAEDMGVDPNKVWIDLCIGVDGIQSIFQAFLEEYVKSSVVLRPCLGPEEYELVRTIDHGSTVTDTWVSLVNKVNGTVLKQKRNEDREKASFWFLALSSRDIKTGRGPAYDIGRWIPHLAERLGLSCEQGFVKSEMTAEDVIFCLDTVWTRAKDISCRPSIRLAFHCATLLGGIGGWRPGSLVNIRYKDIELAWVRDRNIPSKTWPVVFITIHHVKQRKHQIQRDQRSRLTFGMTPVPYKLLCLVTLFTIRAIADNAFKAGFHSCDQVLRPGPLEEGVDFVRLEWRDEVLEENKKIVPISYNQFLDIWNRVHFVAGSRERKRPYSLRVGAGGRLDGSLTSAVRNYTLGNSTAVFERSYQPVQIREALAEIAFGELGKQDDDLWSVISNAFLRRDPFAPIYITEEEMVKFQKRNDITAFRKQVVDVRNKNGLKSKEEQKIWGRIQWIIDCLEKLQLEENRKAYFTKVDGLRALGKSTIHLHDPQATNPRRVVFKDSNAAAQKLSTLITDRMPPAMLPDKIVAYLRGEIPEGDEDVGPVTEDSKLLELKPSEKPRCLLDVP